ncbi:MAG: CHASE3 domain-containing protein [Pseudomonadota bacterium]
MEDSAQRRRTFWQIALLSAGFAILIAIGAMALYLVNVARTEATWVVHTIEAENQVSRVLLEIRRAESAARGLLLTQNPQFLAEYDRAAAEVLPAIDTLASLTADNPIQVRNVAEFRDAGAMRLQELQAYVDLIKRNDLTAATATVRQSLPSETVNRIRDASAAMLKEEDRLHAQRSAVADRSRALFAILTISGATLIVLLGGLSIFLVRRTSRERDNASQQLRDTNVNLEAMVDARTADLREANEGIRIARDRYAALAAEREMLLREVNHRVGNSLQIIASLLHLQAANSTEDDVKAALTNAMGRVAAVAQVHRRLYTSHDLKSVMLNQYLEALLEDLRRSAEGNRMSRLTLTSEAIEIDPDRAVAIGIIVNELVMNAVKYAYPDGAGPIHVEIGTEREQFVLAISDQGVGLDQVHQDPRSTGMGQRIVGAMAGKLGATVAPDPCRQGTRIVLRFPRTGLAVATGK